MNVQSVRLEEVLHVKSVNVITKYRNQTQRIIGLIRKAGNSPTVIMKASGHKTMSMFIRYDLVDEEDLKRMKWVDSESESNNEDFGAKISA